MGVVMKMKIELESQEERELFERMKAKCSICGSTDCTHQVQFMSVSVDDYLKLMDELALARVLIRELGDRLSKLEGKQ
jgi:ribosomal protein S14